MKNQLVILCGGKGTRLGNLTQKTAKPMLQINGQPFLNYLLRALCILPLDEIILISGFHGQKIYSVYNDTIINGVNIKAVSVVWNVDGSCYFDKFLPVVI